MHQPALPQQTECGARQHCERTESRSVKSLSRGLSPLMTRAIDFMRLKDYM